MESKKGGFHLFRFPVFIKQSHHSQQAWIPELLLMTRSEQKHAQLPQPLPNTHTAPQAGKAPVQEGCREAPREVPTSYTSLPNPAAEK